MRYKQDVCNYTLMPISNIQIVILLKRKKNYIIEKENQIDNKLKKNI